MDRYNKRNKLNKFFKDEIKNYNIKTSYITFEKNNFKNIVNLRK